MTPKQKDTQEGPISQSEFHRYVREQLRGAVRIALTAILEEELTAFIGAGPYEQKATRRDHRNGHYQRNLVTSFGEIAGLAVPRSRGGFQTQVFERYHRRQTELDSAILGMYVGGNSTEQVGVVVERLTGTQPSPTTVSRVYHTLEAEYTTWKQRPLATHYRYAFADGTYFSVSYEKEGVKMPVLAVVGITPVGEREVLGFTTGDRENQRAWEDLLEDFKKRGLAQVDLWITDGNQAMRNAIALKFPTAQRQRGVIHKINNVLSYIPKQHHDNVEAELKAIVYQESRQQADKLLAAFGAKDEHTYPTAIECLRRDSEACLTFYGFPKAHWKTIRTNTVAERLFEEVKKRYHKMNAAFPNENSCLLLFFAVIRSLKFKRLSMPA